MNFKSLLTFAFAAAALSASAEAPYTYSVGDVVSANGKAYRVVSENIVENGDFTQGFTYWKAGDGSIIADGNFKILEGVAPNGGNALNGQKNEGGTKVGSIAHKINLENGKSYFVSLFANTNNGTWCRVNLNATDNASTAFISKESMTQGGWCIYSGAYDCNADNQTIDFQFAWLNTEAKFAYINLVEVEEIPTVNLTSSVLQTKEAWGGSGNYTNAKNNDQSSLTLAEKYAQSHVAADYIPLSQEISVPNGKYYISLYATANSANIGGGLTDASMTTAQLFATSGENTVTVPMLAGNNNKFVMPGKYNLEIEVTDGKLNLGMKILEADKVNWQTIQIISLLKESTNDDAINVAKALAQEALDSNDYINVTGEERTALEAALAAENATVESLTAATDAFKNAKPAYDAYASKVVEVNSVLDNCTLAATAKLDALRALIITPANAAAAETATGSFFDAIRLVVESNAVAEGLPTAEDFTSYIINPMAADGINGWTKAQMDGGANIEAKSADKPVLSETTIENYFDGGNWNGNDWTSRFEQSTTGLPAGKYRIAVIARGSENLRWFRMVVTNANGEASQVDLVHVGTADEGSHYTKGYREHVLDFETSGDILISIQANTKSSQQWQGFTNFRLTKIGETEMQSYVVPDTWYYIKQASSNLYWYTPGAALKLSGTDVFAESAIQTYAAEVTDQTKHKDHMFKFMPVAGKFGTYTIETGLGHSLALNGEWSMSTTENSDMSASEFSVEPQGENLVIKTAKGYLSSDDTNANSPLFSNKAADHANAAVTLVTVPQDHISTGIEAVAADAAEGDNVVYDLYGRRVENPSNGIYIVNGKKVVIR